MLINTFLQKYCRVITYCTLLLGLISCTPVFVASTIAGLSVAYDKRTSGTILEDENIELKAYTRLSSEPFYSSSNLTINSYNLNILAVGQVPSIEAKETILAKLKTIPRVKKVYNELEIKKPIPFDDRAHDAWITGKIKTYLKANASTRKSQVAVVTENKKVYLMGIVTADQANKITNVVRTVSGVKQVTRLFEYM